MRRSRRQVNKLTICTETSTPVKLTHKLLKGNDSDNGEPSAKRIKCSTLNVPSLKKSDTRLRVVSGDNNSVVLPTGDGIKRLQNSQEVGSVTVSKKTKTEYHSTDLASDKNTDGSPNSSKENKCEPDISDSEQDESINYLNIREQNIKANQEFFNQLGLSMAKKMLQMSSPKKKTQPSRRGLQVSKEPQEPLLRRYSLRIRRIDPVGRPLPEPELVSEMVAESRLHPGPIPVKECFYSKNENISDEYGKPILSLICSQKPQKKLQMPTNKIFQSALDLATITENRVAKVVPGRVFSVVWHPSCRSLICAAGDKYGHIGFWDVTASETSGEDIVRAFRPHVKPVTDLFIPHADPHKIYSCSYDSTLRCGDFEKEVFDEVFSVPEENDDLFRNFSFIDSTNTMLVSQFSGNVSLVDTRTPSTSAEQVYPVSRRSLRTVSVNPNQPNYFITAGVDAKIALWDLRSISTKSPKPIQTLEHHTKAISSAFFSPTGHKVLSCSSDDTFLIYSVDSGMKLNLSKQMRHNNYTGRWLTKFQPNWHPTVEDVFVSGSMQRPRQIEVFNADGSLLRALTNEDILGSVCSLNVFHPTKTCTLVGANSSGRLHVFM